MKLITLITVVTCLGLSGLARAQTSGFNEEAYVSSQVDVILKNKDARDGKALGLPTTEFKIVKKQTLYKKDSEYVIAATVQTASDVNGGTVRGEGTTCVAIHMGKDRYAYAVSDQCRKPVLDLVHDSRVGWNKTYPNMPIKE